jgi:hypothetical protein
MVQRYAPELNERIRRELKPTNGRVAFTSALIKAFELIKPGV